MKRTSFMKTTLGYCATTYKALVTLQSDGKATGGLQYNTETIANFFWHEQTTDPYY
jgi:hypothetical protein